jgi:hypothetical protein
MNGAGIGYGERHPDLVGFEEYDVQRLLLWGIEGGRVDGNDGVIT